MPIGAVARLASRRSADKFKIDRQTSATGGFCWSRHGQRMLRSGPTSLLGGAQGSGVPHLHRVAVQAPPQSDQSRLGGRLEASDGKSIGSSRLRARHCAG